MAFGARGCFLTSRKPPQHGSVSVPSAGAPVAADALVCSVCVWRFGGELVSP